jgi:hypothetical protein
MLVGLNPILGGYEFEKLSATTPRLPKVFDCFFIVLKVYFLVFVILMNDVDLDSEPEEGAIERESEGECV